jgi:hypothetical protein
MNEKAKKGLGHEEAFPALSFHNNNRLGSEPELSTEGLD